jgi:GNAT superfamily N-acetyltransferase
MAEIDYRLATAADVGELVRMREEFLRVVDGEAGVGEGLAAAMREYFAAAVVSGEFVAYLAVAERKVVGASGLVWHRYPPSMVSMSGLRGHILNMYTVPGWRRRGIATELMRLLVAHAREKQCGRVTLRALPGAKRIYEGLGFVDVGTEMKLELSR